MSKELEALERIKKAHYFVDFELEAKVSEDYKEELDIIEKGLLFVEILKKTFKFGVEEQKIGDTKLNWKIIAEKLTNEYDKQIRDFILKQCFPKELTALEIIKKKRVDCNTFMFYLEKHNETGHIDYAFDSYNDYAKDSDKPQITKEEYDLLKEVLL